MAQKTAFLMGNQAIAHGALAAGITVAAGYPGTPSSEIIETIAKNNTERIHVEWSTNEKAALEVASGASFAGARTLVTMKQVGLNVASDPLMSLAYIGIKGGMVVVVADDPGPISSQTEQDTRTFAQYSKLPVFDPSSPEEAYEMIFDAFELSEKYHTPVLLRPTTRVCHGYAQVQLREAEIHVPTGFSKDPKWVIFPRLSYENHKAIEVRNPKIGEEFSSYGKNFIEGTGRLGIACGGISYAYVKEALKEFSAEITLFKVSTPFPFPDALALEFLAQVEEVLVIEELDPVIERALIALCGSNKVESRIHGKLDGTTEFSGEQSTETAAELIAQLLGEASSSLDVEEDLTTTARGDIPVLPIRPPSLCAGCPHRAAFYAVKQAAKGHKAVFSGDIGCYTLGNTPPLDMVDTCLCMGAGITQAQGLHIVEPDALNFAFIGDSTFFASGMTGIVNAVYNQTDITVIILDNSTTAMTGGQAHPGTSKTLMGTTSPHISLEEVLTSLQVGLVLTDNPLDLASSISTVTEAMNFEGVSAVVFKAPCVQLFKTALRAVVDLDKCTGCKRCIHQIGCPALVLGAGKVVIDDSLCNGCGLCLSLCNFSAISLTGGVCS
ncbi:MAG: indolepyruvate ferredoxin oxidoreductase subunit alpha [Coriobacteriia bacterium]|nr:indolepyruvate ferredoxin oxidoreductase subunit alpha [Coriobacteriia bacterium]